SLPSVSTVFPVRQAVSPTRQHRLSSAGEGGSKYNKHPPQPKNSLNLKKTEQTCFSSLKQYISEH
ncbi:hypothetical protein, partial [Ruegeria sp. R14_0]|uniref:hypothetical protein n=1 Tax=Ruegeria sp. R14_0 TaxID=2821100 RepID=UPI001ADA712C